MKRYIKNFMMAMMVGATVFGSSCTDSFEESIQTQIALRMCLRRIFWRILYITHPIVCMIGGSQWMSR